MPDTPSRALTHGTEVELEVTDLNSEGQGVARWRGLAVFVEGGLPGERVAARVLRSGRSYARAETVGILRPSPDRVTPPCPVFGSCGGCQLQSLSYPAQLAWKTHLVRETLRRVGGLDGVPVEPCLAAPAPLGYRNKAQFPVASSGPGRGRGWRTGPGPGRGLAAGLYRRGTHDLVPVEECLLQHPLNNRVISETVRLARESGVPAYDEDTGQGLLRHILARVSRDGREAMAVLVTASPVFPGGRRLASRLRERVPEVRTVVQNINTRRTNVILGPREVVLSGPGYIHDRLGGMEFRVSAASFFQVNPEQAERLYAAVADMAAPAVRAADLYCGVGTITLYLARSLPGLREIVGVESSPAAVRDAAANARGQGVTEATFICGDVAAVLADMVRGGEVFDTVVLDPPRKGCEAEALEALAELGPERVVYVSCSPATLARDLAHLTGAGYAVRRVQPVDMFPQTTHVEAVALVERCGASRGGTSRGRTSQGGASRGGTARPGGYRRKEKSG